MNFEELYIKLKQAYSGQNLNKISVTLINLYKDEQFGTLRQIAEMISEITGIEVDGNNRFFSKLMMLYHPDRGDLHRKQIDVLSNNHDYDGLLGYSHILRLERIEEISKALTSYEDIDYSPVYEWDVNMEGFTIIDNNKPHNSGDNLLNRKKRQTLSFYNAVKLRMYGNLNTFFPPHYLEDLEEMELSQSGITDLDGIQYCTHTLTMDLSDNNIKDISLIWELPQLEDLDISYNSIEDIDVLVNLKNLKNLRLAHTRVRNLTPVLNLNRLEYIDITGLKINKEQIGMLEESGVTVIN